MVKSNYTFEKRKKELAKKKKKEEKRLKKLAATGRNDEAGQAESDNDTPDLGVWEFHYSHLEAVTSIWDSNFFTETK